MSVKLLGSGLLLVLVAITGITGQAPECHFKAFHDCIKPLFYFSHREGSTGFAVNRQEFALLCRSMRNVTDCASNYLETCGTEISKESYQLINEVQINNIRQFCRAGPIKKNYLKHAQCLGNKVHRDPAYKNKCVKRFQATLDTITEDQKIDKKVGASCCAYRFWMECSTEYAADKCSPGEEASKAYFDYMKAFTGGLLDLTCGGRRYETSTRFCTSVLASPSKTPKGRKSKSPVSKYFTMFFPNLSY